MKFLLNSEESDRIRFRFISNADFDTWVEFYRDPNTSLHWKSKKEAPEIKCKKWYEYQFYRYENDLGGMNALVDKSSGKLIGHCGLLVQTVDEKQELEIGYSLLPQFCTRILRAR